MSVRRRFLYLAALVVLSLSACQKAEDKPAATPDQSSIQAASTLFAQPTRSVYTDPTATPSGEVELDLNRLVAHMEQAVRDGDLDTYLSYLWTEDPIFLADHTAWAQDWKEHPLAVFNMAIFSIQSQSDTAATARMSIFWREKKSSDSGSAGGTTVSVIFYRQGAEWLFGGEDWQTLDAEKIRLYYFSSGIVDNTVQAMIIAGYLPSIYTVLTREFGFVPEHTAHLKLYDSAVTLQNWTRLSMPDLEVWNKPGESIKIPLGPNYVPPPEEDVAREYTRFLLYEMSGGSSDRFPWWLEEGITQYGGALFQTLSQRNRTLRRIAARSLAPETSEERLFEWDALQTRPSLIESDMEIASGQAFTLVHYVTETYGSEARNAWIREIAAQSSVEEACQTALGVSLDELDVQWRAWLATQL